MTVTVTVAVAGALEMTQWISDPQGVESGAERLALGNWLIDERERVGEKEAL